MIKLSSVSFFCPAYYDEKNLPKLIPRVVEFLSKVANQFELIIVNDGSPDGTGRIAEELSKKYRSIRVIHHPVNLGYGAALKTGFKSSRYQYIMYTDGDNQYDVSEFVPYLSLLNEYDVLSGYVTKKVVTLKRLFQSLAFNFLIKVLFFTNLKDINCSMKVYKRNVLDALNIQSNSAFIDAEMLIKAKRLGFKIKQFPVTHYPRVSGSASGSSLNVIYTTIRDLFSFRFGIL